VRLSGFKITLSLRSRYWGVVSAHLQSCTAASFSRVPARIAAVPGKLCSLCMGITPGAWHEPAPRILWTERCFTQQLAGKAKYFSALSSGLALRKLHHQTQVLHVHLEPSPVHCAGQVPSRLLQQPRFMCERKARASVNEQL